MHHQVAACALVSLIEQVGKAEIERAMPAAMRIQGLGIDRVETLGSLPVALAQLRAQRARPAADRVDCKALKAVPALHPQLQLELELEDADEHRRPQLNAVGCKPVAE